MKNELRSQHCPQTLTSHVSCSSSTATTAPGNNINRTANLLHVRSAMYPHRVRVVRVFYYYPWNEYFCYYYYDYCRCRRWLSLNYNARCANTMCRRWSAANVARQIRTNWYGKYDTHYTRWRLAQVKRRRRRWQNHDFSFPFSARVFAAHIRVMAHDDGV